MADKGEGKGKSSNWSNEDWNTGTHLRTGWLTGPRYASMQGEDNNRWDAGAGEGYNRWDTRGWRSGARRQEKRASKAEMGRAEASQALTHEALVRHEEVMSEQRLNTHLSERVMETQVRAMRESARTEEMIVNDLALTEGTCLLRLETARSEYRVAAREVEHMRANMATWSEGTAVLVEQTRLLREMLAHAEANGPI